MTGAGRHGPWCRAKRCEGRPAFIPQPDVGPRTPTTPVRRRIGTLGLLRLPAHAEAFLQRHKVLEQLGLSRNDILLGGEFLALRVE